MFASIGLEKALVVACLALGVVAAIPQDLEPRLLGGVCDAYGNNLQTSTGHGMVGQIAIHAAGTGTYIDGLNTGLGSVLVTQRKTMPYYYVRFPFRMRTKERSRS